MRFGKAGREFHCLAIARDRTLYITASLQRHAEIEAINAHLRCKSDRVPDFLHRAVDVALFERQQSEELPSIRELRIRLHQLPIDALGRGVITRTMLAYGLFEPLAHD